MSRRAILVLLSTAFAATASAAQEALEPSLDLAVSLAALAETPAEPAVPAGFGLSGKLRAAVVPPSTALAVGGEQGAGRYAWVPILGTAAQGLLGYASLIEGVFAPPSPGLWEMHFDEEGVPALTVITQMPFARKSGTMLNGYHIGRYPTEGSGRTDQYAPPSGFIEVTRENQDFQISENFKLRQFLTKDQFDVWPKYLALDLRLVDKLELVLQELNAMGVRADRMHVMSGFRTPQYNGPGGNGRAALSRHMYGDAADVWVDNDGNGYMDDLNGDGRVDLDDSAVIQRAVERVERRYPELVGGSGVYVETGAHGPFIHIDVRGERSRW